MFRHIAPVHSVSFLLLVSAACAPDIIYNEVAPDGGEQDAGEPEPTTVEDRDGSADENRPSTSDAGLADTNANDEPFSEEEEAVTDEDAAPPSVGVPLAGRWQGTVSGPNGTEPSAYLFSDEGHLMILTDKEIELSFVGQSVHWLGSNGGVHGLEVVAMNAQPSRLEITIDTSYESSSGGFFFQDYTRYEHVFEVTSDGLQARIAATSLTGTGGSPSGASSVVQGILSRVAD